MRLIATFLLSLVVLTSATAADLKIGVVDMRRAINEFYKTKQVAADMKAFQDKVLAERNERYTNYKTLVSAVQKFNQEMQDPILTPEGKAKAMGARDEKAKEARAAEQDLAEFEQRTAMKMRNEQADRERGLLAEITDVVKDRAKAAGYDFVFDKSGVGLSSAPILLYYKDATDFTDEIIVELNKGAPAPGAKAPDAKPADAAPKADANGK